MELRGVVRMVMSKSRWERSFAKSRIGRIWLWAKKGIKIMWSC